MALPLPQRKAAVDQAHVLDARVAQQPPGTGRVLVSPVDDVDLGVEIDPQGSQGVRPHRLIGDGIRLGDFLKDLAVDPDGPGNMPLS